MLGLFALALAASQVSAQTFRRTAACPNLGCIFPPSQTDFIAGQVFDLRIEVQAPVNGSQAYKGGVPSPNFKIEIKKCDLDFVEATQFFKVADPAPESYAFSYYEDLFLQDAKNSTAVNVISKTYRHIALYEPGPYQARLTFNDGSVTLADWTVVPLAKSQTAKNVILFIGDGMTTPMLTAARLLAHKSINGKYQSTLKLDSAPGYGSQMTHSLDSFITDSANSATALYTGKKSTVNALNAYTDSTGDAFSDPKFESIFEMFRRTRHGQVGAVSTAYIADATPAAVCAHTSQRSQSNAIIEQFLSGVSSNYSWTQWDGIDVLFGGGAESFLPAPANGNVSQFTRWGSKGYQVGHTATEMSAFDNSKRALGIFTQSNLPTWLDRNVYKNNLAKFKTANGTLGTNDVPGLKAMTLKAIDILHTRSQQQAGQPGFALMSEAASIDKQMHVLDYDRALGDVLELDDTVRATIAKLEELGIAEETLVVVTADHGHGFDVSGGVDTHYLASQKGDRKKRAAVGTYLNSGLSGYTVEKNQDPQNATVVFGNQGVNFPVTWNPRYAYAGGVVAAPDRRENYVVHVNGSRTPATLNPNTTSYEVNPADAKDGFIVNGTLPVDESSGVHSLTDVPVYSFGPAAELFRGVQNSVDIAFKIALALDLGRSTNVTYY